MNEDLIWDFAEEVEMFKSNSAVMRSLLDKATRKVTAFAQFLNRYQERFTVQEINELLQMLWNAEK